jgi:hypothetical protein
MRSLRLVVPLVAAAALLAIAIWRARDPANALGDLDATGWVLVVLAVIALAAAWPELRVMLARRRMGPVRVEEPTNSTGDEALSTSRLRALMEESLRMSGVLPSPSLPTGLPLQDLSRSSPRARCPTRRWSGAR